jgi:NLR family CARD domain-containing protein 3
MQKAKTNIGKSKKASIKLRATKRLMRDLAEIQANPVPGVAALPLENNIFTWHANVKGPSDTPWEQGIFHMVFRFPDDYPDSPPALTLSTKIEHPCVSGNSVCLDLLQKTDSTTPYQGWSPAYSVQTILIQLQAFLFEATATVALSNISNPKLYDQKKKEWESGVLWSVEQSLNYQDKTVKHHPPRKPWPPLPETEEIKVVSLNETEIAKNELVCFYTRQNFEEDCIGVGISYSKNLRTGEIKSIQSSLDLISLRAFMNHKLRLSSFNTRFSHWLPIYINGDHGKKAMYLAERSISIICTGNHFNFKPSMVLEIFPKIMSTMVVEVTSGKTHASIKALKGYCWFQRMFLNFVATYPELKKQCEETISSFIKDEKKRHKDVVPNLGEFLQLMTVTDFTWKDIKDAYIEESFIRNVFWILNKYPELENEKHNEFTDDDRLKYSYQVSKTSQKLLFFNIFYMENLAHPEKQTLLDIAKAYDANFGKPSIMIEELFFKAIEDISKIESYEEFFKTLGTPLSKESICETLIKSIKQSKDKGYHGNNTTVLTPEEYAKLQQNNSLESYLVKGTDGNLTLMDDEKKWKELTAQKFQINDLPEYLKDHTSPWKSYYLQNFLEETISELNDVPDFQKFHSILNYGADLITRLEIQMFNPTNITSRYLFLTIIIEKLKKLDTLCITKGESGLGVKGFKALIKGLSKNQGSFHSLILEYCDIDSESLKELTKGQVISGNLSKLSLKGNPLGDQGAINLAQFLRQHKMLPHLEELDLSECKIGNNGAKAIAEALLVKRELKILKMTRNLCSTGMDDIFKNLAYSTTIKQIDFSRSTGGLINGGSDSLSKLLDLTVSLEDLNLWKVAGMNFGTSFYKPLKENSTIKRIDLAETNFNGNLLTYLGEALSKNTTVETLHLERNGITGTHLYGMLKELEKWYGKLRVKELYLTGNNLSSISNWYDMRNYLGDLIKISPNLTILEMDECQLNKQTLESLSEALNPKSKIPLKVLKMRGNKQIGKFGLKPLAEQLKNNTQLELLDLSGCELGVQGASFIATILEENKSITELNLFGNFVETEGGILISKALQKNSTLKSLDLGLNRLRARGSGFIAELFTVNTTLESIGLKHNHIPDKFGVKITKSIIENKKSPLKKISLAGNFLTIPIRSEISLAFAMSGRNIEFDLSKLVENKDPEKQERTVYITPLPMGITEQQIKKLFYSTKCGVCLNVSIYKHKTKKSFTEGKYAFVEFAHVDSVKLACQLIHKKKNNLASNEIRITKAGVQDKEAAEKKKGVSTSVRINETSRMRGGMRGGRGSRREIRRGS